MTQENEQLPEKEVVVIAEAEQLNQEVKSEASSEETKPVEETPQEDPEINEKVIIAADREGKVREERRGNEISDGWKPVSRLGKEVKSGALTNIEVILDSGSPIFEVEIVDVLLPELESELLLIGQAKGKFGGGQRRVFNQTQKKTREGNKPSFTACAVVGNKNGYVGVGFGKSKETVPSREKALRRAKISIMKIRRGSGSWEDAAAGSHSIPFAIEGKCGSVTLKLIPAPKGTGLVVEKECAKILTLAGIKDIWSKSSGNTRTKTNLVRACVDALRQLSQVNVRHVDIARLAMTEGKLKTGEKS